MRYFMALFATIIFILFAINGCKKETPSTPAKTKAAGVEKNAVKLGNESYQPEMAIQETHEEKGGYIYKQKGRRDPFVPLVITTKKREKKGGMKIPGTLESYDITDFTLAAIAKKGHKYYALLVAPDNKSFTVNEGDILGLHKGRIEKILSDKIIMIEYSKDYRGELRPRQIVLGLRKGEAK